MKNDRHLAQLSGKAPARREWPQPADLSPIRTAAGRGSSSNLAEPPVRPVPGWRLPSGQLLVEYALRAGLASSPLLVRLPLLGGGAAHGQAMSVVDPVLAPSLAALAGKVSSSRKPVEAQTGPAIAANKAKRAARSTAKGGRGGQA